MRNSEIQILDGHTKEDNTLRIVYLKKIFIEAIQCDKLNIKYLAASSDLEFLRARLYLKANLVKVVAKEAPIKKSPSIKYLRSGGRS